LQDAVRALREAGRGGLADEIDDVLVGRDVIGDCWTFQLVEQYDEQYWAVFREAEAYAGDSATTAAGTSTRRS